MQLSGAGLALIKQSEGFRSTMYRDVAGFLTIGYGHKLQFGEGWPNGITEAQAETLLAQDVAEIEKQMASLIHVALTQGQYDALVDFVFNLGAGRLAGSTLLRDLNAGQYDAAADQLLLWDHSGAKEVPALKARRTAEFNLWHGKPAT